jgi:DeoR family myo-inositol catabolism operon transcriptional repressor
MQSGFTVSDSAEVNIFRKLQKNSKSIMIVADHAKFDRSSLMSIGPLNMPDIVVTNDNIQEEYKSYFFENGVKIYTSYKIKTSLVRGDEQ